mgnify:CR=1 FL=1
MLKRKTLKVGETEVAVVMIPARQAFGLSKDVAQVAVQLIGALGKLGTKSLDVDLGAIGPELGAALAGIETTKLDSLLAGLLAKSEARVNGTWLPLLDVVDDVFAGRIVDLYLCLFEAVKLNFPDFFARLGQQKGQGQPAQPTP